ncbi:beta-N-acetylhexosaminidase [Sphingosinicella sp. LHD-64]|uniref:beta-N-acetylhexosaminidase n=1 Tax=Sphingosinicella sp. LHD-64 TaxID=3072139 RepID=UPI00280E5A5E|nr:beta-N-acetylhexosaminidase [Sphingosinicella sp. LHD-64]MDQ8758220.1 beta-N-acetylhexosaminidase [Sphingosinicella sp. LHD-64]
MLPAIFGLSGETLSADERAFFGDADPAGYILFARNCRDRAQVRALTDSLRALSGRDDLPILIDQEGGRVARLAPPAWPPFPAAWRFAELYEVAPISAIEAARVNAQAIALTLDEIGINVDCLPLLDVRREGAHDVIGDRALGGEPMRVAALGRAVLEGLEAGGCIGVVKHMPGHGRAGADSHKQLPVVEASEDGLADDLAPFLALRNAPMAMTAHVLYPAWDAECCATLSPTIIDKVIRGRIGFDGFLMSDDIAMAALAGPLAARAEAAIAAGCDVVLHCSGILAESREIAAALPAIGDKARARLGRAMARIGTKSGSYEALAGKRDVLLAQA